MRLLTLDASLRRWSAALLTGGGCLACQSGADSRSAASALPMAVEAMLRREGCGPAFDAVAVTVGPGSFTGLRAALAVAHGLGIGAGVPVIGVTVAEALLAAADGPAWVALDSRRAGRVFLDTGGSMGAVTLEDLPIPTRPVRVIGDAAEMVAARLRASGADAVAGPLRAVDPACIGLVALRRLRGELAPCAAQPLYITDPEVRAAAALRPVPV